MRYYLFSFICLFLSCASQGLPTGGPIDSSGPKIITSTPAINSHLSSEDKIIILFDELINPISVVNAINIFPENKFSYRVIGKKIVIEPKNKWIYSNIIKIKLSRKISDYQNNVMTAPIELFYFNSELISTNTIMGKLINTNNQLFELGLYQIQDSIYQLIEKTQSNEDNIFEFKYINNGEYFIVAVADSLTNIENNIRQRRYGMITDNVIDFNDSDTISVNIQIDSPINRLSIQSFEQINNSFGYIVYDNGSKDPFMIPQFQDSLLINANLKNRLELYSTSNFSVMLTNIIDTVSPGIKSFDHLDNFIKIILDEPIKISNNYKPIIFHFKDSSNYKLDYNLIDSFIITVPLEDDLTEIFISNLTDLYNNTTQDTLSISIQPPNFLDRDIEAGNIYGSIIYEGDWPIIVKAESINSDTKYFTLIDSNNNFSFINMEPDFYTFSAFEFFGGYDSTEYFSGLWEPISRAAKFGYYPYDLEIRKHWDIKDMIIEIK